MLLGENVLVLRYSIFTRTTPSLWLKNWKMF
uniref:Uncharacterized protein n=1 Tax=Anopheles minimus TaxID=112268 RepID=A0A182WPU8_9DIPT